MSTKRELIIDLRAHRAGLVEQQESIDAEIRGIDAALTALGARTNSKPTERAQSGSRQEEILTLLRQSPDKRFGPNDIAEATGMISSTAATAMRRMIAKGEVEYAGKTSRGAAIVKHKPTVIKPGYEVVQS